MGFTSRLPMQRFAVAALALASLFSFAPGALQAQEKAPDAVANATDPVVVVTLGSVNKLLGDVSYLTSAVGQPQAGQFFLPGREYPPPPAPG